MAALPLDKQCDLLFCALCGRRPDTDGTGTAAARPALLTEGAGSAAQYYAALQSHVAAVKQAPTVESASELLLAGIQCLAEFVQQDMTGPPEPHVPLWVDAAEQQHDGQQQRNGAPASGLGQDSRSPDERWVEQQLQVDGEDVVGRFTAVDRLLAALLLLVEPLGYTTTGGVHAALTWQLPQHPQPSSSTQVQHPGGIRNAQQANGSGGDVTTAGGASSNDSTSSTSGTSHSNSAFRELVDRHLPSWRWWAMRAVLMQQEVVSGPSATLFTALQELTSATLAWAAGLQHQRTRLAAAAHLEAAQVFHAYGHVEGGRRQLELAGELLGLSVGVTGALGRRTLHQIDPKAQLVVHLQHDGSAGDATATAAAAGEEAWPDVDVSVLHLDDPGLVRELAGMRDESEVYAAPQLDVEGGQQAQEPAGHAHNGVVQALLLGWATQVRKGNAQDELAQWQAAPYVEAVLQQRRSQYMLQVTARLLKARHERERPRTRERALMQMEALATSLSSPEPPSFATRAPYSFAVRFPLRPLLRKELAESYIGMGLVGAALVVFEELEMWDQLILCYQLLDKREVARTLINQRLKVTPDEPRLWCALGDLDSDDAAYETAWERSRHRSARAQRSLARSALRRKDWAKAAGHWGLALGLSPMHPQGWFSLGYCRLKLEDKTGALQAFTKVTQLEPDNGEAWNNIAALWMQQQRWREAFSALSQATKHKRDSWQAWENYAQAGLHVGALMQATRALGQVLELTSGQRLFMPLASRLVEALEEQQEQQEGQGQQHGEAAQLASTALAGAGPVASPEGQEEEGIAEGDDADDEPLLASEQLLGLLRLSGDVPTAPQGQDSEASAAAAAAAAARNHARLLSAAGTVLKGAANAPACTPALWGLLARWHSLMGSDDSAKEAWLKAVRGLQGTAYKADAEAFEAMADASVQLANAYIKLHRAGKGGARDLAAARMHLRGVLRSTEEVFGGSEASGRMREVLEQVVALEAEAANSSGAAAGAQ